ncbi:MAG: methyltransferase domain-containing protein [Candidatus Hydrogenedentota bacterium]
MSDDHVKRIQEQFDRQGEAYANLASVQEQKILSAIVRLSRAGADDRVLDVASGPGFIAMAFAPHCKEVVGVDVTETFLASARDEAHRRDLENVTFEFGTVESLPFEDAVFDVAVCRSAFHHFPNPDTVLSEMTRVVKPGGRLLILDMVASEDAKKAAYHHKIEMLCDPTHAKALSPSEFTTLFEKHDLTIEMEREGQVEYPIDEWIGHGGPSTEAAETLRSLVTASVDEDLAGLPIRKEGDTVMMGHYAKTYVLRS